MVSPQIWQKIMEQVFSGMNSVCIIFNDMLVTGKNNDEYLRDLEEVFQSFLKYGLWLRTKNCAFLQPIVKYYGFCISRWE